VFIVLKLTKFVAWSWWWVLSPIWISFLFWIVVIVGLVGLLTWLNGGNRY